MITANDVKKMKQLLESGMELSWLHPNNEHETCCGCDICIWRAEVRELLAIITEEGGDKE
jgi:hypothetical protein